MLLFIFKVKIIYCYYLFGRGGPKVVSKYSLVFGSRGKQVSKGLTPPPPNDLTLPHSLPATTPFFPIDLRRSLRLHLPLGGRPYPELGDLLGGCSGGGVGGFLVGGASSKICRRFIDLGRGVICPRRWG